MNGIADTSFMPTGALSKAQREQVISQLSVNGILNVLRLNCSSSHPPKSEPLNQQRLKPRDRKYNVCKWVTEMDGQKPRLTCAPMFSDSFVRNSALSVIKSAP